MTQNLASAQHRAIRESLSGVERSVPDTRIASIDQHL
jgi:hypothetical protein